MPAFSGGKGAWVLSSALLIPFLIFGFGFIEAAYFIGAVIFTLYLCLLILNFEAGFLTLIFIRSSLDYLKNFTGEGSAVNFAGIVSIALIILGIFYVLYCKVNILKFEDSVPFLVFLAFCGLSVFFSPNLKQGLSDWLRLVSVFSVYLLARIIFVTEKQIRRLFLITIFSALAPVLVAYYQLITGHGSIFDGGQYRIVGTFLHPNAFASYLLIFLIFCTAQILERTHFVSKNLMVAFTAAIFLIFLFTFSRGAWVVFILVMLLMGFLRYKRILGFLPLILTISILLIPGVKERIINIFDPGYTHGRSAWEWRLDAWSQISSQVAQKPMLGHGLSSVETEFGFLTHNDYLRLLAETGALGLLAYLFLAQSLLKHTWRDFKNARSDIVISFQVGLLAMIVGFLVREFADNTLRDTVTMIYLWIFIALSRNIARTPSLRT